MKPVLMSTDAFLTATGARHTPGRIDSTAFRRGVRAAKTGASNPYNGPELRDEWEAGRAYAKARGADTASARARAFVALMAEDFPGHCVEGHRIGVAITKATGSAS